MGLWLKKKILLQIPNLREEKIMFILSNMYNINKIITANFTLKFI